LKLYNVLLASAHHFKVGQGERFKDFAKNTIQIISVKKC